MTEISERRTDCMIAGITITRINPSTGDYIADILLRGVRRQYEIYANGSLTLANYIRTHTGCVVEVTDQLKVTKLFIGNVWYLVKLDEPVGI